MAMKTIEEVIAKLGEWGRYYTEEYQKAWLTDDPYHNRMLGRASQCRETVNFILGIEYDDGE